jgi:hypothetical protein
MNDELAGYIGSAFRHGNDTYRSGRGRTAQTMVALKQQLDGLLRMGKMVVNRRGMNFVGEVFQFQEPDPGPVYNPETQEFVATCFNATFGAEHNSFGLNLKIDRNYQVVLEFTGGASSLGGRHYPLSNQDQVDIQDLFHKWLIDMRLCDVSAFVD